MAIKFWQVEVVRGVRGAAFWRIRWPNGEVAAHSETYERKATAVRMARKVRKALSEGLGSLVVFEDLT